MQDVAPEGVAPGDLRAWLARTRVPTFTFEAFDENWKGGTDPADVEKYKRIVDNSERVLRFTRDLVNYAHGKGLQVGVQILDTAHYSSGWCWGMDSVALGGCVSHPVILRA